MSFQNDYIQKYGKNALEIYRKSNKVQINSNKKENKDCKIKTHKKSLKKQSSQKSQNKCSPQRIKIINLLNRYNKKQQYHKLSISNIPSRYHTPENKQKSYSKKHIKTKSRRKFQQNLITLQQQLSKILFRNIQPQREQIDQIKKIYKIASNGIQQIKLEQSKINTLLNLLMKILNSFTKKIDQYYTKWVNLKIDYKSLQTEIQKLYEQSNPKIQKLPNNYHKKNLQKICVRNLEEEIQQLNNKNQKQIIKINQLNQKLKVYQKKQSLLLSAIEQFYKYQEAKPNELISQMKRTYLDQLKQRKDISKLQEK